MNNLQYVGFWERFLATLIDNVLFLILTSFILLLFLWKHTSTTPDKDFFQARIIDVE